MHQLFIGPPSAGVWFRHPTGSLGGLPRASHARGRSSLPSERGGGRATHRLHACYNFSPSGCDSHSTLQPFGERWGTSAKTGSRGFGGRCSELSSLPRLRPPCIVSALVRPLSRGITCFCRVHASLPTSPWSHRRPRRCREAFSPATGACGDARSTQRWLHLRSEHLRHKPALAWQSPWPM